MAGGAGKALRGGGARRRNTSPAAQVKDGGHGRPPHPLRLVPGQVYWPRQTGSRRHPLIIVRVDGGETVRAKRVDGNGAQLTLSTKRLLCRREDGQGRFYSFLKWSSRRYVTWALVAALADGEAVLVLPEWHPDRAVRLPERFVPVVARGPGKWLTVAADLSQPTAAGLQVATIAASELPPDATEVRWRPPSENTGQTKPKQGPGCGDIVLEDVESLDQRTFFVRERPAGLAPGGRVYLTHDGNVVAFVLMESARISPNGISLNCRSQLQRIPHAIALDGTRRTEAWRWRWWPVDPEH